MAPHDIEESYPCEDLLILLQFAGLLGDMNRHEEAATLFAAALAGYEAGRRAIYPCYRVQVNADMERSRVALAARQFCKAWASGSSLSLAEAIYFAKSLR